MQVWQLQDAKARMSELVKRAQDEPQSITLHGRPMAVVVSQATFDQLSRSSVSLVDFMRASPLFGDDELEFPRDPGLARPAPDL